MPVQIPNSLLVIPCEAVGAGDTVRSLARGYVKNTSCIGEYRLLLEKQKDYNQKIEALFKDGNTTREYKAD